MCNVTHEKHNYNYILATNCQHIHQSFLMRHRNKITKVETMLECKLMHKNSSTYEKNVASWNMVARHVQMT
jgi:hypothetical protein